MSRQARAEPITGPTRTARSRTISVLSPAAAADVPDSMAASNSHILREVMASSVRTGSARAGSQAFCFLRLDIWLAALRRCRGRFLSPLHELLENVAGLGPRRRIALLSCGQPAANPRERARAPAAA